jgi:hypothetical protein
MQQRDEHHLVAAQSGAAKPDKAASAEERWLRDAIEDDEVREILGIPHRHKTFTQGAG